MNEQEPQLAEPTTHTLSFRRPGPRAWVRVQQAATRATVILNGQVVGTHLGAWTPFEFELTPWLHDENTIEVRCEDVLHTTNGFLPTLGVRWTGPREVQILTAPTPAKAPAPQRSAAEGTRLLVDGRPFRVRGILHWGYYPELGRPWPDEEQMRREIRDMQSLGFNLIKFCLWIPPPRYYEWCDEWGMLVWQEYPVWNAPLNDRAILAEFEEFFRQDGPHPCVILRTLTCENDRVDRGLAQELIDLAHRMIPGCLVLDNSAWLCAEHVGDFHDEHPYLHNAQWQFYARRIRHKLTRPLLLGETINADTLPDGNYATALAVRRFQIETLAHELPDAGYVINAIRDIKNVPLGLYTYEGRLKYTPQDWSWHGDRLARPRQIPPVAGPIIGPRKGEWKHIDHTWWSPIVKVLDPTLPVDLIERECVFDLLSGRVLTHAEGTRVLVELWDVHSGTLRRHPLVVEFSSNGQRRVVSAFRHDTPAGRELWAALVARTGPAPEIGPLVGTSIVLEDWELSLDEGNAWAQVKCDTPLVNHGRNVFEGRATFRTRFDYPGGRMTLRCEAVGDYFELLIDGVRLAEAGPKDGTWDGTRDVPREYPIDLPAGVHDMVFHVRDWRGAGGMVGPVFLARDLSERIF